MHHVGVALDRQELAHPDRAIPRDAPHVVPGEVDEHHVLGLLLRVGEKRAGERLVLLPVAAAGARARERPHLDPAVLESNEALGGRAHQRRAVPGVEEEHVRRGIHHAEGAVDGEGVEPGDRRREALREDHLVDVTGPDVLLRALHGRAVGLGGPVRPGRQRRRHRRRLGGSGAPEAIEDLVDPLARPSLGRLGAAILVEEGVRDDAHRVAPVVEGDDAVHQGQAKNRKAEVVGRPVGEPLPQAHGVVREVPEEAAGERGQLRVPHGSVAAEMACERLEGAPPLEQGPVGPEDPHLRAVALQQQAGIPTEDREARHLLRPLDALEQEARREVAETEVGGDRGLQVGEELARDGHHVGGARQRGPSTRDGDQRRLGTGRHRRLLSDSQTRSARLGPTALGTRRPTGRLGRRASGLRPKGRPPACGGTQRPTGRRENQKAGARGDRPAHLGSDSSCSCYGR